MIVKNLQTGKQSIMTLLCRFFSKCTFKKGGEKTFLIMRKPQRFSQTLSPQGGRKGNARGEKQ